MRTTLILCAYALTWGLWGCGGNSGTTIGADNPDGGGGNDATARGDAPSTGDGGSDATLDGLSGDGAGGDGGNVDAGDDDAGNDGADDALGAPFQCGPDPQIQCDPSTQFCQGLQVGPGNTDGGFLSGMCASYPTACKNDHSCVCVEAHVTCVGGGAGMCTEKGGDVTLVCVGP